jgi:superfamily I DNA/RNA helicase
MGTVALLNFGSEVTEARGIADLIDWLNHSEGIPLSEILILSRTDYRGNFTRRIRDELARRNIVVFDQAQVGRILGEPQNRKLLALLRVAVNRRDSLAWWTLIHLEHGIGSRFIDGIYEAAVGTGTIFGEALVDAGERGFPEFSDAIKRRVVKFYKTTIETVQQLQIPTASPDIKWGEWINSLNGGVSESTEEFKALLRKIDETYPDAADGLDRYLSQSSHSART